MPKTLDAFISTANGENDAQMAGFMLKIAAIILSSYQEVSLSALVLNAIALCLYIAQKARSCHFLCTLGFT